MILYIFSKKFLIEKYQIAATRKFYNFGQIMAKIQQKVQNFGHNLHLIPDRWTVPIMPRS
jgi:hypothetical protein